MDLLTKLASPLCLRVAPPGEVFHLASGGTSDYLIDLKPLICRPDALSAMALGLLARIYLNYPETMAVAGVPVGGLPIATAVSLGSRPSNGSNNPAIDLIIVRKQAKDHGTGSLVDRPPLPYGARVVLVEDVMTTGGSSRLAISALLGANLSVIGVFCVVDREERPVLDALEVGELRVPITSLFTASQVLAARTDRHG